MPPRAAPASPSESWTVEQVAHWLRQLQVPMNVIAEFISNDITGKALFLLEDDDLEYELLVRSLPQRRTILAAVERARSMAVAAAAATSCAAAAARASTESSAVARRPAPAPPADVRGTPNGHAGSALASAPASQALMLACHLSNSDTTSALLSSNGSTSNSLLRIAGGQTSSWWATTTPSSPE